MLVGAPRQILVILPTWVGDFVMATPLLRAVRDRFREARIAFLAEPNLRDLIAGGDWMDDCAEWPARDRRMPWHREYRDLVMSLRKRRFDLAILLPNSFRAAMLARLGGAKRRAGYDRDGRGWLLSDRVPVRNREENWWQRRVHRDAPYELAGARVWPGPNVTVRMGHTIPADLGSYRPIPLVEYYADLAEAIGCERPDDRLELFTTADCDDAVQDRLGSLGIGDHHPLVIISPGAKFGASKCWPPDRFAATADQLIETEGANVVITCGPGEEPIAREIGRRIRGVDPSASLGKVGGAGFVFDNPRLSLGELKSLIRRSDLLLCNDAGPRHIAKAFGVPVATVFGPTHPEWTATSHMNERIVRKDVDCGPCQQKTCPLGHKKCMTEIGIDIVHAACAELLNIRQAMPTGRA